LPSSPQLSGAWPRPWAIAGIALVAAGVAIRVNNAIRFPTLWGFDARPNYRYIERLMASWELPAPDADWSTSHPPFFYYLFAALGRWLGHPEVESHVIAIRLVSSAIGLVSAFLAVALVRRVDPANPRRAVFAGALVLLLPVHIYMSAMVTEEILVSSLVSLVLVGTAYELTNPSKGRKALLRAAGLGLAGGLAVLTKLSGALVVAAAAGAYTLRGLRLRVLRPALSRAAIVVLVAALTGGWYYYRNLSQYGYLYPHALEVHSMMFDMPPGERHISDYLRVPLATWADPWMMNPDLLRSVWGGTYASFWFDAHRYLVPRMTHNVTIAGASILTLAILPTLAFLVGAGRGIRRALRSAHGPDALLLLLVALTLAGYVFFTWRNPWYAVVKGSYLLGLSVPFSFYSSEVLADWTRDRSTRSALVWTCLVALLVAVAATFTFARIFWDLEHPADIVFPWEPPEAQ
jgi:hypothetical protein